MATINVSVGYRPVRIGWCVRQGNFDDFRRALRLTHTLWGGRFNPLIPIGQSVTRTLVRVFGVDILIPAQDSPELLDFAKSFPELYWPDSEREIFPDRAHSKAARFVDVKRPIELIKEQREKERVVLRHAYLFATDAGDPLQDVLLATFGGYPSLTEIGVDYSSLFASTLAAERIGTAVMAPGVATGITPSDVSAWNLEPVDSEVRFEGRNGLYLGSAASFEDLVTFWNLRAAGLHLRFLDQKQQERMTWMTDEWLRHLVTQSSSREAEDTISIRARSLAEFETAPDVGPFASWKVADDDFWDRLPDLPNFHWNEQRVLASLALEPFPHYSLQLPASPAGRGASPLEEIGVTVRVHGDLVPVARTSFWVPGIRGLNMFFSDRAYPAAPFSVRVSRDYFTLCISALEDSLNIAARNKTELISKIFELWGIHAEMSQPGVVAMRLIEQMGDLERCGAFRFPGVRRLIDQYSPLQSFTRSGAIQSIRDLDPGTGLARFDEYLRSGEKLTPESVFDFLLDRRVFRAGLEFLCPHCSLGFWTAIDSLGTEITCELCGMKFNCTAQLKSRGDWRFRRSGLFGKDDHQEGGIPVALTLRQLNGGFGGFGLEPTIFTTAMKLTPATAAIRDCETDFVLLRKPPRGPLDLVIGECKSTGGEITQDDLDKLGTVASEFDPQQLKVYILLSKTGEFTSDEVTRLKKFASSSSHPVIMLSSRELEPPLFTYEWAAREFQVDKIGMRLEDMVRNTDTIFFNPRRR